MSALYGFTSLKQQDLNNKGTISRIRWEFELASRAAALEQSGHEMDMEIEMEEQPEREQVRIRFLLDTGQITQSTGLSN